MPWWMTRAIGTSPAWRAWSCEIATTAVSLAAARNSVIASGVNALWLVTTTGTPSGRPE